jgi:hypothetical protein
MSQQVVYFAQAPCGGPIKIGHTIKHNERLAQISNDLPWELIPVAQFRGGRFRERFVQCWFHGSHMRGEWFGQTPELWRWMFEAKSTGDILLVPPEPPHGFISDTEAIKSTLEDYEISISDIARVARVQEHSVRVALSRPYIDSLLLIAAVRSLALGDGTAIADWGHYRFVGDVAPRKRAKRWPLSDPPRHLVSTSETLQ